MIQVYAPTSNAEEAEVEWFYEDLQEFLELKPQKDVLFIIGDWNAKVGSQETPGVIGKFGPGVQNEAVQFSSVAQSCPTLCDLMGSSLHQAPPSMGFSRPERVGCHFLLQSL